MPRAHPRFLAVIMIMAGSTATTIPLDAWAQPAAEAPAAAEPASGPQVPAPAEPPVPATAPEVAAPSAPTDAPAEPAAEPTAAPAISADMLDAAPTPAPSPASKPAAIATPSPAPAEALTPNEAITRAWAPKFRPKHNPGRLNVAARLLFANAGGAHAGGGRLGGAAVDVGQSFNRFGYALTATAWGGRFALRERGPTELNALLGVGPTVGLGRMALLGRGFLDLRVGYDFYYGVVNQRDDGTVVRPQGSGDIRVSPTRNLAPHGPRARLDLGLLSLDDSRRFVHGLGLSMGYQALVGSFRGDMPVTHMLTLGLAYWMG